MSKQLKFMSGEQTHELFHLADKLPNVDFDGFALDFYFNTIYYHTLH